MDASHLDWFFSEHVSKGVITLSSEESRHLKVKRHSSDERVAVFDGKGIIGIGKIVGKDTIDIAKTEKAADEATLIIATAIPKGDREDFLVQKLTELNVKTIIPLKSRYSVVIPKNAERMRRIALEACKQCKRAWAPEIREVAEFSDVLKEKAEVKVILDIEGKPLRPSGKKTIVLVGPEGGFTEEELALAEKAGFVKASAGKNTLRIETAALAAGAILNNL